MLTNAANMFGRLLSLQCRAKPAVIDDVSTILAPLVQSHMKNNSLKMSLTWTNLYTASQNDAKDSV